MTDTVIRPPEAIRWAGGGTGVDIIDQTLLPEREVRLVLRSPMGSWRRSHDFPGAAPPPWAMQPPRAVPS
jgi:hypothetical protein